MVGIISTSVSKNEYRELLLQFFQENSFQRSLTPDPSIEEYLLSCALNLGVERKRTTKLAIHGAGAAQWFYPQHSRSNQLAIGLFTLYFTAVDDLGLDFLEDIKHFRRNVIHGEKQIQLLEAFSSLLRDFDEHYEVFCSDKITTGLMSFMGSCAMEFETTGRFRALKSCPGFPRYFRIMTGLAEPYVYFILRKSIWSPENMILFIQAVPDLMDFTDTVNDILSFYKEPILSTERNVYHRAMSEGVSTLEVLKGMTEEVKRHTKKKLYHQVQSYMMLSMRSSRATLDFTSISPDTNFRNLIFSVNSLLLLLSLATILIRIFLSQYYLSCY